MKIKKGIGSIESIGNSIHLDANSTSEELEAALKAHPNLSEFIEIETPKIILEDVEE